MKSSTDDVLDLHAQKGRKMKRGVDYFRALAGTVYKMKYIQVVVDPAKGKWVTRKFIGFMSHGKVRVDMATCGGTSEIADFKFWRFPVYPCHHCLAWSGQGYKNVEELAEMLRCVEINTKKGAERF